MGEFWNGWSRRPTPAFLWALLRGGAAKPLSTNPNTPGEVDGFNADELQLIVDEGRRQIDAQRSRFQDVQGRAQTLLTVSLVVLGFTTGVFSQLDGFRTWKERFEWVVWVLAAALVLVGLLLAAAVISVRAIFGATDTTQITTLERPLLNSVAADYAQAVRRGEVTIADRVNAFQVATRYTVWGAILTALVFLLTSV